MSRRQSRVSTDIRQNDTLLEFENFKKKFLLANKHITKLNSTLSVRIEELNAQISTLYVENLRLRASEIALASQLKRERERSRRIMADAEAATHNLMKHLGSIRKSFNVPHVRQSTPEPQPPTATARAKRPAPDPNASPAVPRLARPPTVPGIYEDDEEDVVSEDDLDADVEVELSPTPKRRKTKPRLSSSRLPLPSHIASPPPGSVPEIDSDGHLGKSGKRRPTRRQSGLLTSMSITTVTPSGITTELLPARPPSPAYGSPLRREVGLAEEEDEKAVIRGGYYVEQEEQEVDVVSLTITKRDKKEKKPKDKERGKEKEKERARDKESSKESSSESGRTRERERESERKRPTREPDDQPPSAIAGGSKSKLKDVTNSQSSHLGLPLLDTAPVDHERQRTPDNDIPTSATSTRTSSSGRTSSSTPSTTPAPPTKASELQPAYLPSPRTSSPLLQDLAVDSETAGGRERRVRKSINYAEPKLNTKMRKPDRIPPPAISVTSTSKRTSISSCSVDVPARRSSLESSTQPSSSSSNDDGQSAQPSSTVRRKKSRPYVYDDDDESEGTQADAEAGALRSGRSDGWVNIDGRRRSVQSGSSLRRLEGENSRRHSMAV
ncbi:hypothetical protein CERSUDRAFT_125461 [Gelatoporia subvermispora B]|uniref:Shugoshin C-terminal domain-containing protein n=1 Tax=Ceriporiopsis subvermispora (strain B) TaxID=914234 RepID=M2QB97_CERS8|nr:hypothetical protein CERSUDRAFT_125461 [Gelatoporia subvermispora B]